MKIISEGELRSLLKDSEIVKQYLENSQETISEEYIDSLLSNYPDYSITELDNFN